MKTCSKCKIEKPFEDFCKHKTGRYGLYASCRKCVNKHYEDNKEKNKQKRKEYYKNNKEYQKEYQKEYIQENKEKIKEKRKEYILKNIEKNKDKNVLNFSKKTCKKCKVEKELNLFYIDNRTKDGFQVYCKECFKEKRKISYLKNKENTLLTCKKWYENNKEKMLKYREDNKEYFKKYDQDIRRKKLNEKYYGFYLNDKIEIDIYFNNKEININNALESVKEYRRNKSKTQREIYLKDWKKNNPNWMNEYIKKRNKEDKVFRFRNSLRQLIITSFKRGSFNYKKKTKTEFILGCTILEFRNYIESKFTKGMNFENHGEWHLDHIIPLASATTEEEIINLNHYTNFQPLWAEDNRSKGKKIIEKQLTLI